MLAFGFVLGVFGATASPWIQGGDNGEFVTIFARGGAAHPPGYPLYSLWLSLFRFLPVSTPALGAALATAVLGALTVPILALSAKRWGASSSGAWLAALFFPFTHLFWSLSTAAEVFAAHAMLVALVLWQCAPARPSQNQGAIDETSAPRADRTNVWAPGLLLGIALCNHQTAIALLPLVLAHVFVASAKMDLRGRVRSAIALLLGLAAGLLPYALLLGVLQRGHAAAIWPVGPGLGGVIDHVLRREYGTFQLAPSGTTDVLAQLEQFGRSGLLGLGLLAPLGFLGGAFILRDPTRRVHGFGLLASFLLAGPVFFGLANISLDGAGPELMSRFALMSQVMLVLGAGVALSHILTKAEDFRRTLRLATLVAVLTPLVAMGILSEDTRRLRNGPYVDDLVRFEARVLPPNAIIVLSSDASFFAWTALQQAERQRLDVSVVQPAMCMRPWYVERLTSLDATTRSRLRDAAADDVLDIGKLVAALLVTGRPVFIAHWPLGIDVVANSLPNHPWGSTVRILPPGEPVPSRVELERVHVAMYATIQKRWKPRVGGWGAWAFHELSLPWNYLTAEFAEAGDEKGAKRNGARARRFDAMAW